MFKNASKLYFAIAGLALAAAIAFAAFTGDHKIGMDTLLGPLSLGWKGYVGNHVGYAVLVSTALSSLVLGIFATRIADADTDRNANNIASVPPAAVPAGVNYWPVVGAFSVALLALGLAIGPVVFVMGIVGVAITLFEWTVRAWSDRATGDLELNRQLRNALMFPFEFPAAGVLTIAGIALVMWKIMMALPSYGSIIVFSAIPALILAFGALLVTRPKISSSVIAGVIVVAALALVAGGITASVVGEREHHGHETSTSGSGH